MSLSERLRARARACFADEKKRILPARKAEARIKGELFVALAEIAEELGAVETVLGPNEEELKTFERKFGDLS